jgi:arsenate reductase (thioredoxin)
MKALKRKFMKDNKVKIIFLCVANSARSQMAEGLARHLFQDEAIILSAGSKPTLVHPLAIKVMQEIGIDISVQTSKSVDEIDLSSVDYIITLCADEVCPYVPGLIIRIHWPLPDPVSINLSHDEQLEKFRQVRDHLKESIEQFKLDLKFSPKK